MKVFLTLTNNVGVSVMEVIEFHSANKYSRARLWRSLGLQKRPGILCVCSYLTVGTSSNHPLYCPSTATESSSSTHPSIGVLRHGGFGPFLLGMT